MVKDAYLFNNEKRQRDSEYIQNLTELSGGQPDETFSGKIAFYLAFLMNGFLYDEEAAHRKAEEIRNLRKKSLEDATTSCELINMTL